ncbi:hypothetical protein J6590_046187, partial [Homalodisca vitripennis]
MAEWSKALRSGRSPLLWAWSDINNYREWKQSWQADEVGGDINIHCIRARRREVYTLQHVDRIIKRRLIAFLTPSFENWTNCKKAFFSQQRKVSLSTNQSGFRGESIPPTMDILSYRSRLTNVRRPWSTMTLEQ